MFRPLGLRVTQVSTKLLVLLLACLAVGSAVLGYVNIRLHRHDLEQVSLEEAVTRRGGRPLLTLRQSQRRRRCQE